MALPSPPVDRRSRTEVAARLRSALLSQYAGWPEQGGAGNGLVEVLARFAELGIERINRAPDRSRVQFLSHLGGALLPPQPARVPLTFSLAPGSVVAAVVPARTQVAAAPAPGTSEPILFETEAELVVTAAKLDRLVVRIAANDRFTDLSSLLRTPAEIAAPIFTGSTSIEHILYIGTVDFFGAQRLNRLVVSFDMEEGTALPRQETTWEIWSDSTAVPLKPQSDGTEGLTRSGDVVFQNLPKFASTNIGKKEAYWLCSRLLNPLSRTLIARSVTLEREVQESGLLPEVAFLNTTKLDLSKDFFPLGERPKFNDAFYLMCPGAFALSDAQVTLHISVTNPAAGPDESPIPRVNSTANAMVVWEYWNGTQWSELGTMNTGGETQNAVTSFLDTTRAFTTSGEVRFRVPEDMHTSESGGVQARWVRARLVRNGYGEEATYEVHESKPGVPEYVYKPATVVAPALHRVEIDYDLKETARSPDFAMTVNDFLLEDKTLSVRGAMTDTVLFRSSADSQPALYLGFDPPVGLGMPSLPLTLYFVFGNSNASVESSNATDMERIAWQYWDGSRWITFNVADKTGGFSYSGRVTFIVPEGAQASHEFGLRRYWLRVPWQGNLKENTAPLRLALANTTDASQAITFWNEILGSSSGAPKQTFVTARRPILEGEVLEVKEPPKSLAGLTREAWVEWINVPDFYASGPLDPHYVLDRMTGEVKFGDGIHGAIPVAGSSNLRLTRYRTGGGTAGNKGYDTIIQLKTTVPYVRAVTNVEGASGGADAETLSNMLERAPRSLRHQSRAVTVEDYEDLALLASPEVVRARCIPLKHLLLDPDAAHMRPGVVSILIVARSDVKKPLPSQELLARVRANLEQHQSATVELVVASPEFVELDVSVEIGIATLDGMSELEAAVRTRLTEFMHPLHGGFDRKGWDFGRQPHRSDLMSLVSSMPGVHHLRNLRVLQREERPGAAQTNHFVACPGEVHLTFTLVDRDERIGVR